MRWLSAKLKKSSDICQRTKTEPKIAAYPQPLRALQSKQPQQQEERPWDCLFTNNARWSKNEEGQQTVNEYVLLEELGKGSYGRVYLCERRVGDGVATPWRRFAMKVMSKPRLRRLSEYVNVPAGGMRKVTAEEKVRVHDCASKNHSRTHLSARRMFPSILSLSGLGSFCSVVLLGGNTNLAHGLCWVPSTRVFLASLCRPLCACNASAGTTASLAPFL